MTENFDFATAQTENIVVSACHYMQDETSQEPNIYKYCLQIENNSNHSITLLQKEIHITDENGRNFFCSSIGFNGELPQLQSGEYFEYEDEINAYGNDVAVYGFVIGVDEKGKELKINLPVICLSSFAQKNQATFVKKQ